MKNEKLEKTAKMFWRKRKNRDKRWEWKEALSESKQIINPQYYKLGDMDI